MDKEKTRNITKNFLHRRLRCTEFAITNACIAKCSFCNIWRQSPKVFTEKSKALDTIDRLADFGVSHLTLTGGEPLLHPDIIEFVQRATARHVNNAVLVAAPRLLMRKDMIPRLEDAGCDLVSISYDSGDPQIMAKSRCIENIMSDMEDAMNAISKTSLKTMASVLIWNDNYDRLEEVCKGATAMGFNVISLNYPTFSESRVYTLGGEGVSLTRENVIDALEDAINIKKARKYDIINSIVSMKNIINYLKDPKTTKYPCYGGKRVLFVDWFCDVRPCMQLEYIIGNMSDIEERDLNLRPCNKCNMSWYRDFSTFFHGARSIPAIVESVSRTGKLL